MRPAQAFAAPAAAAAPEPKKRDLTVNKVIAGASAAATSAVLGSFFGAMGTVAGAALGSVFSAVVTSVMQHSLDKTRDTVKAHIKLPGGGTVKVAGTTEVPAPRPAGDARTRVFVTPGDQATEIISAVPAVDAGPPTSRRRLLVMTGFTVVVFAIGMLAITGLELVKGSPLNTSSSSSTSQRSGGTSLGSVFRGSNSASTETSTKSTTTSEPTSEEPTTRATTSKKSTDEDSSAVPGTGFGADQGSTSTRSTRVTPTPDPTSGSGASDHNGRSDGGATPQPDGGAAVRDEQQ